MCTPKYSEPTLSCVGVSGKKFPMPGNEWEDRGDTIIFKHRYDNGKMNRRTTSLYKDIIASIDGVMINEQV